MWSFNSLADLIFTCFRAINLSMRSDCRGRLPLRSQICLLHRSSIASFRRSPKWPHVDNDDGGRCTTVFACKMTAKPEYSNYRVLFSLTCYVNILLIVDIFTFANSLWRSFCFRCYRYVYRRVAYALRPRLRAITVRIIDVILDGIMQSCMRALKTSKGWLRNSFAMLNLRLLTET
jgi:hypothetical protein